jgi:molybdopterin converting factor subunit 1
MQVKVRYFAALRERVGKSEDLVEVEPGTTVGGLFVDMFPPSSEGSMPAMFAVNQVYVDGDYPLKPSDEVAFIPPLGGG